MTLTLHDLSKEDYERERYLSIVQFEGSREPLYLSKNILHIGVGFNVTDANVLRVVLVTGFGLDSSKFKAGKDIDGLISSLLPILSGNHQASELGSINTLLNAKMVEYTTTKDNFTFESENGKTADENIRAVFDVLALTYEDNLSKFLDSSSYDDGTKHIAFNVTNMDYSKERLALFSLQYNDNPSSDDPLLKVGNNLSNALKEGDRCRAWFEIRYHSNGVNGNGPWASRRMAEADIFGLYNDSPENDATKIINWLNSTYEGSTTFLQDMLEYEKTHWKSAKPGYYFQDIFKPIAGELIAHYLDGEDVTPPIELGENFIPSGDVVLGFTGGPGSSIIDSKSHDGITGVDGDDVLIAIDGGKSNTLEGNKGYDILIGESGNDILRGGDDGDWLYGKGGADTLYGDNGNDTLFGGGGVDTLIGGLGDDYLDSGVGSDTYLFDSTTAFGSDTIVDADDSDVDAIKIDNTAITNLYATDADSNIYRFTDDKGVPVPGKENWSAILSGTTLTIAISDAGGTFKIISIKNFDKTNNNFGITLDEMVAPTAPELTDNAITITEETLDGLAEAIAASNNYTSLISNPDANEGYGTSIGSMVNDQLNGKSSGGNLIVNYLQGLDGDDVITGDGSTTNQSAGDPDILVGGKGNDQLYGGGGSDQLYAMDGQYHSVPLPSTLRYNPAEYSSLNEAIYKNAITLEKTDESNYLDGGDGNDVLAGASFKDTLLGGAGNDLIYGGQGQDLISGGDNNDRIFGDSYALRKFAGVDPENANIYYTTSIPDFIAPDALDVGEDNYRSYFYKEDDSATVLRYNANLHNGNAEQKQQYNALFNDIIDGGAGDDQIFGEIGDDIIYGGDDNDILEGDRANAEAVWVNYPDAYQTLSARYHGNDVIDGGSGKDTISGNGGNDLLMGGTGDDAIHGDELRASTASDALESSAHGKDTIFGDEGNDKIDGGGNDDILNGGDGSDILWGDYGYAAAADEFEGKDTLIGGAGKDTLLGEGGNDVLDGGTGKDDLKGGAGTNTYIFRMGGGGDAIRGTADESVILRFEGVGSLSSLFLYPMGAAAAIYYGNGDDYVYLDAAAYSAVSKIELGGASYTLSDLINANTSDEDDDITGTNNDDVINTGAGNDDIDSGGGNDTVDAGEGDDYITADSGYDVVDGGDGVDVIYGDWGNDTLYGGAGNDELEGGDDSSTGNDTLYGGDGDDRLEASGEGDCILNGDAGDDSLYGMNANDTLNGGAGNDLLSGGGGQDTLDGGDGIDTVSYGNGAATVNLGITIAQNTGDGYDTLRNIENIIGGNYNDTLTGNESDNMIAGGAGNDTLDGAGGNDTVSYAGADAAVTVNLTITTTSQVTGQGTDTLRHFENIQGGGYDDTLTGDTNANVLDGGLGDDVLAGGVGNDVYVVNTLDDTVTENANEGSDTIQSSVTYTLGTNLENLTLIGSDNIHATGNSEANILSGNSGNNTLIGGTGNDTLIGGDGDDVFSFAKGDGDDLVSGSDAGDVIELASGISSSDVYTSYAEDGDVILNIMDSSGNTTNSIRIDGDLQTVEFVDEPSTTWALDQYVALGDKVFNIATSNSNSEGLSDAFMITPDQLMNNDTIADSTAQWLVTEVHTVGAPDIQYPAEGGTYYFGDFWGTQVLMLKLQSNGATATFEYTVQQSNGNGGTTGPIYKGRIVANFDEDGTLTGGSGNDFIDGVDSSNDQEMDGKGGDDTIIGGAGNDVVIHTAGEGDDVLIMQEGGAQYDKLILIGSDDASDVTLEQDGNDLLVHFQDDTIRIKDYTWVAAGELNTIKLFETYEDYKDNINLIHEWNDLLDIDNNWSLATTDQDDVITVWEGSGNEVFDAQDGNDYLNTMDGDDTLTGGGGNDTLVGGTGNDMLIGGTGDDTFVVDSADDVVNESTDAGIDLIQSAVTYTLANNVENLTLTGLASIYGTGNALANILTGNSGVNTLTGGDGNDTYIVQNSNDVVIEANGEGTADLVQSSADFTLGNYVENLTLTGLASINGTGNSLVNTLTGNDAINTLAGAEGNDIYVVQNAGDVVVEDASEGTADLVQASVSYVLSNEVENLTLTGSANINATGNSVNNILTGNSANNILDGGAGTDSLIGGAGDDVYIVDTTLDVITDYTDGGVDEVQTALDYTLTLSTSSYIENLTLTGGTAVSATGNSLDNVLTGNSIVNTLTGGLGNDTYVVQNTNDDVIEESGQGDADLVQSSVSYVLDNHIENLTLTGYADSNATGNSLANVLTGNAGYNTLTGGADNDIYVVQDEADVVVENASEGTADLVQASVSYVLSSEVENLTLTGSDAINATGNSVVNILTGNSASNTLDGGAGADSLIGGAGNDVYIVDYTGDTITESSNAGVDVVLSSVNYSLSNHVDNLTLTASVARDGWGNSLANILTGNAGYTNTLYGGDGNDTYVVQDASDRAVEATDDDGTDTVISSVSYTLGDNLENLTLTGANIETAIIGTGNSLANILTGDSYGDEDVYSYSFYGRDGNDTYLIQNEFDTAVEGSDDDGADLVISSFEYSLGENIENLTLTGADSINGFGNSLANTLTGNSGDNTLRGGDGDDIYVIQNHGDVVIETSADDGADLVMSSVSFTLDDSKTYTVENLTLTGTGDIHAYGNSIDNILVGNSGHNTIDGGLGSDDLSGGVGNDVYVVDNAGDIIHESVDQGTDLVLSSVSFTLGNNVENLTLTGPASWINGEGNSLANILTADTSVANITLYGRDGNDTYVIQDIGQHVVETTDDDGTDLVMSALSFSLGDNLENLTLTGYDAINATGNGLANILIGNDANNTLTGGAGDDIYVVQNTNDVIVEASGEGTDLVQSSVDYALANYVDNLTLIGDRHLNATGSSLANTLTGNSGNNTLDGAEGADSFVGSAGNDVYIVDNAGDVFGGTSDQGTDLVLSSVNFTLDTTNSYNVENLTLTGTAAVNGTGNSLANILTGNAGYANTLYGLDGDDTYVVQDTGDRVVETSADDGTDLVMSSVTFDLSANSEYIENLTLTGTAAINGTGNSLANVLTGNAGYANTLYGLSGDDTYVVQDTSDEVVEGTGAGADLVMSSVDFTLDDNVENLTLTGGSAVYATGNSLANVLTGNSISNTLTGYAGNDTYVIQNTGDVVVESSGEGTDLVMSSFTFSLSGKDNLENLTLTGVTAINGTGNTLDNVLMGNNAINILDGGTGADTLAGNAGDDTYIVDNTDDVVIELVNQGTDLILSSVDFGLGDFQENLTLTGSAINGTGNALRNVLTGNSVVNTLSGGDGNDTYVVQDADDEAVESANEGTADLVQSSVTYVLADDSEVENLTLTGTGNKDGTGNSLANILTGNATYTNTLYGLDGNDTYVVQDASDVVVETSADDGTDLVMSSVTFDLGAHSEYIENLTLTGSDDVHATGNSLANILTGNSGNNTLDGSAGADSLIGGAGNDIYLVDNGGDAITESASAGTDSVQSSVTYTLSANVENLTLTGSDDIHATGNSLANILTGNSGNNSLIGGSGNDTYVVQSSTDIVVEDVYAGTDWVQSSATYTLSGNVENLTLTGSSDLNGTGNSLANILTGNASYANTLYGQDGNDTYVIQDAGDRVVETTDDSGTDLVMSSVAFTLSDHIENLTLTGSDAINGTGNSEGNILTGNASYANTLYGKDGDDVYVIQDDGDRVVETTDDDGTDLVMSSVAFTLGANIENLTLTGTGDIDGTGNSGVNILSGNTGNNTLDGSTGADQLIGGQGNDVYIVDNTADTVTEDANAGTDLVESSVSYLLGDNLENLTLTGGSNIDGMGNSYNNILTGNSVNNTLDGGAGNDTMIGGEGNDVYIVDNANDSVTEDADAGTDLVESAVSYGLGENLENLTLSGADDINGVGNANANIIIGNLGENTLTGGDGNDTYVVQNEGDAIQEYSSEGTDIVESAISYALSDHVENLTLTGDDSINATGNSDANTLTGNSGDNMLDGNAGADNLIGGAGNDVYIVDHTSDVVSETTDQGIDLVMSSVAYSLTNYVENLTLTGTVVYGTGNSLANVLTGNTLANSLTGGLGNDTYVVQNTDDVVIEAGSGGTDWVESSVNFTLDTSNSYQVENLTLTGSTAVFATGNSLANILMGNSIVNTLTGGLGNDTYVVQNTNDFIVEGSDGGTADLVLSSVNYTLVDYVDNLTLTGDDYLNATGNSDANTLTGNGGNNTLDGAAGADSLIGGAGNDVYIVDNTNDGVTEYAGEGIDLVQSSVSYSLSAYVENLTLTGASNIHATGNSLANVLTGNSVDNSLSGGAGNDTVSYANAASAVTVDLSNAGSQNTGGAGTDTLTSIENLVGSAYHDTLTGDSLANMLNGGAGNDTLIGGAGNDTASYSDAGAAVTVDLSNAGSQNTSGAGTDTLTSIENLIGGIYDDTLTGNSLVNVLNGGAGNDILDGGADSDTVSYFDASVAVTVDLSNASSQNTGGAGWDTLANFENVIGSVYNDTLTGNSLANTLTGGAGNDTYVVQSSTDIVVEGSASGTDLVVSSASYTLSDYVEKLTLSGGSALNGTGNSLGNVLTGNSVVNILSGAVGADSLIGAAGNDTLSGGSGSDAYLWSEGDGNDVVNNYDSGAVSGDVDILKLIGTSTITDYRDIWFSLSDADGQSDYNDLVVSFLNNGAQIMVEDWANSAEYQLDKFSFDNGSTVKETTNTQTSGSDNFDAMIAAMSTFGAPPAAGWYADGLTSPETTLQTAINLAWGVT